MYSGALAGIIGRKWTLLLSGIPLLIGWILVCVANSIAYIYAARIIWGLAVGQLFTVVPMYVGEIAEVRFNLAIIIKYDLSVCKHLSVFKIAEFN